MTLTELVVALAIMGTIAAVAGLALESAPAPTQPTDLEARIAALRDSALATGQPLTRVLVVDGRAGMITAHPDGRVLAEAGNVESASGRPRVAR